MQAGVCNFVSSVTRAVPLGAPPGHRYELHAGQDTKHACHSPGHACGVVLLIEGKGWEGTHKRRFADLWVVARTLTLFINLNGEYSGCPPSRCRASRGLKSPVAACVQNGEVKKKDSDTFATRGQILEAFMPTRRSVGESASPVVAHFVPREFRGAGLDMIQMDWTNLELFLLQGELRDGILQSHVRSGAPDGTRSSPQDAWHAHVGGACAIGGTVVVRSTFVCWSTRIVRSTCKGAATPVTSLPHRIARSRRHDVPGRGGVALHRVPRPAMPDQGNAPGRAAHGVQDRGF